MSRVADHAAADSVRYPLIGLYILVYERNDCGLGLSGLENRLESGCQRLATSVLRRLACDTYRRRSARKALVLAARSSSRSCANFSRASSIALPFGSPTLDICARARPYSQQACRLLKLSPKPQAQRHKGEGGPGYPAALQRHRHSPGSFREAARRRRHRHPEGRRARARAGGFSRRKPLGQVGHFRVPWSRARAVAPGQHKRGQDCRLERTPGRGGTAGGLNNQS